jgi:hypothetical protein
MAKKVRFSDTVLFNGHPVLRTLTPYHRPIHKKSQLCKTQSSRFSKTPKKNITIKFRHNNKKQ